MGTPDSPVRTRHSTVHCLVRATSADRWGLELFTIEVVCPYGAPDSPVRPDVAYCLLTSDASDYGAVDRSQPLAESTVAPWAHRTVQCTPDSPMNFSGRALRFPRSASSWSAPAWALDTVRCTTGWCKFILLQSCRIAPRSFSLHVYMNFMHL
jgi:hypothetical protein